MINVENDLPDGRRLLGAPMNEYNLATYIVASLSVRQAISALSEKASPVYKHPLRVFLISTESLQYLARLGVMHRRSCVYTEAC